MASGGMTSELKKPLLDHPRNVSNRSDITVDHGVGPSASGSGVLTIGHSHRDTRGKMSDLSAGAVALLASSGMRGAAGVGGVPQTGGLPHPQHSIQHSQQHPHQRSSGSPGRSGSVTPDADGIDGTSVLQAPWPFAHADSRSRALVRPVLWNRKMSIATLRR